MVPVLPDKTFQFSGAGSPVHSLEYSEPQETVLGPIEFISNTLNNVRLIDVNYRLYADDKYNHILVSRQPMQLYRNYIDASQLFRAGSPHGGYS